MSSELSQSLSSLSRLFPQATLSPFSLLFINTIKSHRSEPFYSGGDHTLAAAASSSSVKNIECFKRMASGKVQPQAEIETVKPHEAQRDTEPCWKKKAAEGGFLTNMKDHFDEFVNTSMDQHRICLKKTIRGIGDRLKKTGSRSSNNESNLGVKEVESSKQVQTTPTQ